MSHLHSSGETRLAPPLLSKLINPGTGRHAHQPTLGIDRQYLTDLISDRRATLSALEMEMVGKCEEGAARAAPRTVRFDDRGTWDRAMWDRYLSTAAALEPDYMPQMLRLHAEIEQLDKILLSLALPATRGTWTKGEKTMPSLVLAR